MSWLTSTIGTIPGPFADALHGRSGNHLAEKHQLRHPAATLLSIGWSIRMHDDLAIGILITGRKAVAKAGVQICASWSDRSVNRSKRSELKSV
jgi:hypothetical protein